MTILYGRQVRWTERGGGESVVGSGVTFKSQEEADVDAWCLAIQHGWTPRRWWQWWRWGDTPNPPPAIEARLAERAP